ncbi:head-tail adaptor protein [Lactobacillus sp. CC-MHH1034]|uniref:head-tail adaptor protein n=1 Tax=Agrilactobacillus fermenti TaxID=2586909 RepID=UPI001E38F0CA|nr:head-tail adaptor protein [Agrilactobacillus fermenti]MCD2255773.1 head-tail adaptor protein [Agrilactobacillus fermenti]
MRYNTLVTFINKENEAYNPDTGRYESLEEKHQLYASVTSEGIEEAALITGGPDQETIVIRLREKPGFSFDKFIIGQKQYKVLKPIQLRHQYTIIGGEMHG